MAGMRTILNVVEKGLDGLPIYGPKAIVSATSEALKALQECGTLLTSVNLSSYQISQTSEENDEGILEIIDAVEKTQAILLAPSAPASLSKSTEINDRILRLIRYAQSRLFACSPHSAQGAKQHSGVCGTGITIGQEPSEAYTER
jgi:methyl-accepting chemotaxis protein